MTEVVETVVTPEEGSYDDAFDSMWKDGDGPNLEAAEEPEVKEEEVPEVKSEESTTPEVTETSEPEVTEEPEKVTRPTVAARDPYSWIEGLPEEQREAANKLKHTALSDRGRVSALTRKLEETQRMLETSRTPAAPAPEDSSGADAHELPDSLRRLQEDYPELGKQLANVWKEQEATLKQEFSEQLKPIQEARTADALASEQQRLEEEAAVIFNTEETGTYWKDVVQSEDFAAWLDMQPKFIQDTARTSNDAQDGIDVLRMYESDYQAAIAAKEEPASSNDAEQTVTARGDKLKAQRQQRQATTVSPASTHKGMEADGVAGDYDSAFDAMWGGKRKK